ncbi:unnamed protein product [Tilletia controversa]|uniref:Uncharacterized protein n=3 Tax=Tilletia TaxID=13289 RepID=A0A8X7MV03_9BASI|nr:hypothetical protein CF335_g5386 [Tilletia laevis]KAE8202316.1 hypothetical protein CF328_g2280 [Tilletia controversa]KAE8264056.1 hypothetical protein A4X03_0g1225 [Tilletia caries]KAE8198437.1 hypothetical protein CF336_g1683 [Tilletia laevis]KAE8250108.1 hypothetical protein A4X06_0g2919 [Tilletia controversa]
MTFPSAFVTRSALSAARSPAAAVSARQTAVASTARRSAARSYSSSPSVSDPKITSKLPQGSDSIWAISSVLVFGSLFFYLTSPPKAGAHGHGGGHDDHKQNSHAKPAVSPEEAEESDGESGVDFVVVDEPQLTVQTAGGDALKQRETDDHGKQAQANNKSAPLPNRGETFAQGIAASKDGNPISDPKAVVAKAHEIKKEKYGLADGGKDVAGNASKSSSSSSGGDEKKEKEDK